MAAITTLANTSNTKYAEVVNDSDAAATGINPEHLKTLIHNIFIKVDEALAKTNTHTNDIKTTEEIQDIVGAMFTSNTETRITATYVDGAEGAGKINLVVDDLDTDSNTTYAISVENGDNTDEEKIRITASTGGTDDIVLEAGTGLTIARDGDKITFTNTVTDTTYTVGDGGLTQNNFTDTLKNKLDGIASGAEQNVQSDWNSSSGDNQILNKPTIPVDLTSDGAGTVHANNYTNTTYSVGDGGLTQNNFTNADHTKLNGIEDNATADQTQSDINALGITQVGTISSGTWQGTAIGDSYISSASTWNGKQGQLTFGLSSGNTLRTEEAIAENDILLGGSAHVKGRTYAQLKSDLSLDTVENGAQVNVSGNSGNAAIYDNSGTPTLKTGITASEVRTAIGAGTSNLAIGTSGSTALAGNTAVGDSNVKSNWNESNSNSDAFIQNKPNVQYTSAISTGNNGLVPAAGSAGEFLKHDGTFGTPSYIANTDTDVSVSNLESKLGQMDNSTVYIGQDQNTNIQPRGETHFGHAASFVNQPADSYLMSTHYIQWDQGNKYNLTLQGANINFTSHPTGACNVLLKLTQPASGSTFTSITWSAASGDTILWPSGTAPTLSSANGAVDILSFYFDGANKYYGVASLNFS